LASRCKEFLRSGFDLAAFQLPTERLRVASIYGC
jgi:hypothetical protein